MQECLAKDIRYRQGTWLKSRPLLHNTASYLIKNSFNLYVYSKHSKLWLTESRSKCDLIKTKNKVAQIKTMGRYMLLISRIHTKEHNQFSHNNLYLRTKYAIVVTGSEKNIDLISRNKRLGLFKVYRHAYNDTAQCSGLGRMRKGTQYSEVINGIYIMLRHWS
jgi:hypothetical protein